MRIEGIYRKALKIALIYLVLSALYIIFSDRIVNNLFQDAEQIGKIQTYKGFVFVLVTSGIIFILVYRELLIQKNKNALILEQKKQTEELYEKIREANIELIKAKEKAEESDKLKTAFLQNLSHEIRTPLNGISGFASLLKEQHYDDDKRRRFADVIIKSSEQLLSVVSDIITISALETKQEGLNVSEVNLNALVHELQEVFSGQAEAKGLLFSARTDLTDEKATVLTDGPKLKQILTNLLSNALKFTSRGFVEFGYSQNAGMLEFFVKDSGIGIHTDMHEQIFDRFRQVEVSLTRNYGGTGLGLSISKGLVKLIGGDIWLESTPGKGALFKFTIPYKQALPVNISSDAGNKTSSKSFNILVVEDELANRMLLDEILSEQGYRVIQASNGQEAVDICREQDDIDLVLMDIKMPRIDGYTAAGMIREFSPGLKIIAQTAYALENEISKYKSLFDGYITKPFDISRISVVLNKYLD